MKNADKKAEPIVAVQVTALRKTLQDSRLCGRKKGRCYEKALCGRTKVHTQVFGFVVK